MDRDYHACVNCGMRLGIHRIMWWKKTCSESCEIEKVYRDTQDKKLVLRRGS